MGLVFSNAEDGAYCRNCVTFGSNSIGKGHQNTNILVQTAFRDWKKALDKFRVHKKKYFNGGWTTYYVDNTKTGKVM